MNHGHLKPNEDETTNRKGYQVRIDGKLLTFPNAEPTGREMLGAIDRDPENYFLVDLVPDAPDQVVELDDPFDLGAPGVEELVLVSKRRHLFVYVDERRFDLAVAITNGQELLALVDKCPCGFALVQSLEGESDQFIDPDETVDVSKPGVERFVTVSKDDVTVFVHVDDEERPVAVRRGSVSVAVILAGARLTEGYILFQEQAGGLKALDPASSVAVEGCETFQAQVKGGASS